jgi:excisionase family DNA binding protein
MPIRNENIPVWIYWLSSPYRHFSQAAAFSRRTGATMIETKDPSLPREIRRRAIRKRAEHTTPQIEPLALTIPDACRLSGLGRTLMREIIAEGKLASVKVRNRRLVLFSSLKAFLEAA